MDATNFIKLEGQIVVFSDSWSKEHPIVVFVNDKRDIAKQKAHCASARAALPDLSEADFHMCFFSDMSSYNSWMDGEQWYPENVVAITAAEASGFSKCLEFVEAGYLY